MKRLELRNKMSTSIYWEPVEQRKEHKHITDQLKYILAPRYWDHDGSLSGNEIYLGVSEIPYLCGIGDGTRDNEVREGIEILVTAIKKYGCVKIWLE